MQSAFGWECGNSNAHGRYTGGFELPASLVLSVVNRKTSEVFIMEMALTFNEVQFDIINRNGEPWITLAQIASALGYSKGVSQNDTPFNAIRKLYTRHADEFTDTMTALVKLPTEGGEQETRIFSLRGCHLLAMLARTPVAKQFRKWVLDVLDRLALEKNSLSPDHPITPSQQATLRAIVKARIEAANPSGKGRLMNLYGQVWNRFCRQFGIARFTELPQGKMAEAVAYLAGLELKPKPALEERPKPCRKSRQGDRILDLADSQARRFLDLASDIHSELCRLKGSVNFCTSVQKQLAETERERIKGLRDTAEFALAGLDIVAGLLQTVASLSAGRS